MGNLVAVSAAGQCMLGPVRRMAAAPVAGQQMPFPGGLTFESQTARLDGRCRTGDRRQGDERGREGDGRTINLVPGSRA